MSFLVITDEIRAQIKALAEHAENNPYSIDNLMDIRNGDMRPPGQEPGFFLYIPADMKVVLTVEEQPNYGFVKHLSASVSKAGRLPHPTVITILIQEMGFKQPLEECYVIKERITEGHDAISIYDLPKAPKIVTRKIEDSFLHYVIFNQGTTDFFGKFVVRQFNCNEPLELVGTADTLEEARKLIPSGHTCLARHPDDDPVIEETWI